MTAANIRSAIQAHKKRREGSHSETHEMEVYWLMLFEDIPHQFGAHISKLLEEFGAKKLLEAIGITADKCWVKYGSAPLKYLHGVCRRWRDK
jgi:hypothetical protein